MPARTSAALKVLNGTIAVNSSRARDEEAVVPKRGRPERPAWARFTPREQEMFDWIMAEYVIPGIYGKPDGALIVELAKVWSAYRDMTDACNGGVVSERISRVHGEQVTRDILSPEFIASSKLFERWIKLMTVLGFTPVARMKLAPPLDKNKNGPSKWNQID
jgi:phage terminase small subunit